MDDQNRLQDAMQAAIRDNAGPRDLQVLEASHPADIAQALNNLPAADQIAVFKLLPQELAGEVLAKLGDETLLSLVAGLGETEVSQILEHMPAEHAADVVEELPAEQAEKILDLMEEEKSEDVQELLEYPEDSAGRLMSTTLVAVPETATVKETVEHIRRLITEERAFEVFVVDSHHHLVGVVPLRRLLIASPDTAILAIRDEEVQSVRADMDREEVAQLAAKYDLVAVPVVDAQNRLLGMITVDDIVDIVGEEASEDIFRLAGSDAAELERRSPREVALMRLPWIFTTLVIELLAGVVIHHFDRTLAQVILLASFMPVIQAISGNTGLQSVTMVVRGLATGQVRLDRWWEPLRRQIQTSSILGAVCALVVGTVGFFWHSPVFGLVVATSMFISVNLSGAAGTVIPMLSKRLGFDPALTAGPFETALQDVLGVTVFLGLATTLLHWLT
jgi:magnesium transporter